MSAAYKGVDGRGWEGGGGGRWFNNVSRHN